MKTKKRLLNESWTTNPLTGEQVSSSKTFSIRTNQDEFYMSYIEYMARFFDLTSATDIKTLVKLCMKAEYNTGIISLSSFLRKELMEYLKITSSQLSRSINKLKELDLLSGEKGFYTINPKIFWKGENKVREEIMKKSSLKVILEFTGV